MKTIILLATISMAGISSATATNAAPGPPNDPAPTLEIRYTDLDLTRASDQVRLKHRLGWAASVLCAEVEGATPAPSLVNPTCYRASLQDALGQMKRAIAQAEHSTVVASDVPRK